MLNSISYRTPSHWNSYNYSNNINFKGSIDNDSYEELKEELDSRIFTFETYDGEEFEGTIKDYFKSCIIAKRPMYQTYMYHCTTDKDTAMNIINNGLDWTKTNRMKAGPGTYFSPSSVGGSEQGAGSIPIEGVYIGNKREYPVFSTNFYEAITGNQELNETASKYGDSTKLINKYCHDLLQYDLGIDFLYASTGRGTGAYSVLNNDCLRLSKYYW